MAGPVWDGSDEEVANEDMMKHDSNINEPTTLYLPLPHFVTTTPFLHASLQLSMFALCLLNLISNSMYLCQIP